MSLGARALLLLLVAGAPLLARAEGRELSIDMHNWPVVTQDSGPVDYYKVVEDPAGAYIHSEYLPGFRTTTHGYRVPDTLRRAFHKVSWKWRAITLPIGGDECTKSKGDSAAVVYLTWKRALKWYALKYVWSAVGTKGACCDRKGNPFRTQATVILESGPPLGQWVEEQLDLDAEFRKHFGDGDPNSEVPEFVGIGIMSDGDQTHSASSADFGGFVLREK